MPSEDRILITSNDSRIRLYDLRDLSMVCKYKGYTNLASQIKACFSPDGRYICAGSENQCVFLWSTNHVPQVSVEVEMAGTKFFFLSFRQSLRGKTGTTITKP